VTQGLLTYWDVHRLDIIVLFMTAVSLAIAAVPEGLPAVVTICLALGMQRMVNRHALLRKLPAVETLGCATVICSDKTGTLTQNEMTVVRGWAGGKSFQVTGEGYNPTGQFLRDNQVFDPRGDSTVSLFLQAALLCNDARLDENGTEAGGHIWRIVGDPTEGALVAAAAKAGLWRPEVEKAFPRIKEIPFDSERKRMTTIHRADGQWPVIEDESAEEVEPVSAVAFVKGAPDLLLELCDDILKDGQAQPLTEDNRLEILAENQYMGRQALRVLAVAYRPLEEMPQVPTSDSVERNSVFLGLLGMIDPARQEVKAAVQVAKGAGLKTVMVTGDYKDTAVAIAKELGLMSPGGRVITGAELEQMSEADLAAVVDHVDAYARVSPQHKVKIVDAFKAHGHVVAMTGDGVNDAPALKRADIGVAMGITGTDVSKETADMVLTDDNYTSIVSAIEEGRIIYSNIRKFVYYLISCNIGEILIIFLSMLAGLPIPLRPIQLLWLNLVTDGAPALALGLEKGDPGIMRRPPRPTDEPVINNEMLIGVAVQAVVMTAAVLAAFLFGLWRFPNQLEAAQTVAFATLIVSELLRAFTARSEHYSLRRIGLLSNRWMLYAVGSSLALLLLVIYIPFLQQVFGTVPLSWREWLVMAPFMVVASVAAEVTKFFLRRRMEGKSAVPEQA
jgi:Ca2+-transporting ATPase